MEEIMCTIVTVKEKEVLKELLEDLEGYITKSTSNNELDVKHNLGFTNYIETKKEYMNIIDKHFDPKQIYVLCVKSYAINESFIKERLQEKGFSNGIIIIQGDNE